MKGKVTKKNQEVNRNKDGLKEEYKKTILNILTANPRVERIVLFGSRAMGTYSPESDIDLILYGDELTFTDLAELKEKLEETTIPQKVDLLLAKDIEKKELLEHIKKHGVEWWRRKNNFNEDWEKVTIKSIASQIAMGPFGSDIKKDNFVSDGVPVIRGHNLTLGRFRCDNFVFLTEEKADQLKNANAFPGDLIFTHRGTLGQVGIIPEVPFKRYVVSQSQMKLTCDRKKAYPLFIYYYFKSPKGQHALLMNQSQTGVPAISRPVTSLKSISLLLPPLPEQHAIAHILGTLDDKIELNRQMNETLEKMAQAIFKSWFVDFDPVIWKAVKAGNPVPERFAEKAAYYKNGIPCPVPEEIAALFPDSFEDSELGPIPKGWRVGCVADLGKVICGKTPPTKNPENYGKDIPFVTIPDMHGKVYVTETGKCLSKKGADTQKNKYLPPHSVCVSCIATPGLVVLTSKEAQTNQQINSVIPKVLSPFYVYGLLHRLGNQIRAGGSGGSVFANLNKSRFSALKVLLANEDCVKAFHVVVEQLYHCILENQKESSIISNLRDTLLPKLISGELRVPDAEKLVEVLV